MRWVTIIRILRFDNAHKHHSNWRGARGATLGAFATVFGVYLNSVENWARWWRQRNVVGLF